jgi:hypothetical protein
MRPSRQFSTFCRKEAWSVSLALEASAEIAKQLHHFALIALATAAGIIFGRALRQGNFPRL